MSGSQRLAYNAFAALDPSLAERGHRLADAPLTAGALSQLREEAVRLAQERVDPSDPRESPGKDGCGLSCVVPGLDRRSSVVFDIARSDELADFVTRLIGPGWVPFRSQLLLPSTNTSPGQWHQDQPVFADHFNDEIAVVLAVAVDQEGGSLEFSARQPEPGRAVDHIRRSWATFEAAAPDGPAVRPDWPAGTPLGFHAYAVHRWAPEVAGPVFLFGYRSSRLRRQQ